MPKPESRELKDGSTRWFVRIRDPRPGPKQGKWSSRTFINEPAAIRFCNDCDERGVTWALDNHDLDDERRAEMTLDVWAEQHFASLTEPSSYTLSRYRKIYEQRWKPHLGGMRLSTITRVDVAKALKLIPGSDKTVLNSWSVLTHMFKTAVMDGHLEKSPCVGVKPGRKTDHEKEERRYLTHEEFRLILDRTPEHWKPLILFLGGTGCRWGEALALTVGDVDLKAKTVRINKAWKRDGDNPGKYLVGPTKTKMSKRTVTLPDDLVTALKPLKEGRKSGERLFTAPQGGEIRHKTFYLYVWQHKILGVRQIPRYKEVAALFDGKQPRLHDLRHSHVAWLIAAGAPLPVIQARLGHEKITTTIDTYGHLLPDLQKAAAEAANLVFRRPVTPPELAG